MSLAFNDLVEIRLFSKQDQQTAINVLHYQVNAISAGTPTEQQVCDAFRTYIAGAMASVMNGNAQFRGVGLRKIYPAPIGTEFFSKDTTAGGVGADALPKQTCGLISWRCNGKGPKYRGRTYIPFPDETSSSAAGAPIAAYVTDAKALADKLLNTGALIYSGVNTITLALQVIRAPSVLLNPVVYHVVPYKWATQRRRGDFGRPNALPDALA